MNIKPTIQLTLISKGEAHIVYTHPADYTSLMGLISERLGIPGLGLCNGMGSCGTCLVEIQYSGSNYKISVLSCQMAINDSLANAQIFISDFY